MFLQKEPHQSGERTQPGPGFQQRLGLFDATMLVVGTMIGSGIFVASPTLPGRGLGRLADGRVGAGRRHDHHGALSYAELAAMMPHAGGQYVFLREAYSPLWGFLYGWTCFLVIQTGSIAAVAVVFAKFLGVFVPALGTAAALPAQVPTVVGFIPNLGWAPRPAMPAWFMRPRM